MLLSWQTELGAALLAGQPQEVNGAALWRPGNVGGDVALLRHIQGEILNPYRNVYQVLPAWLYDTVEITGQVVSSAGANVITPWYLCGLYAPVLNETGQGVWPNSLGTVPLAGFSPQWTMGSQGAFYASGTHTLEVPFGDTPLCIIAKRFHGLGEEVTEVDAPTVLVELHLTFKTLRQQRRL